MKETELTPDNREAVSDYGFRQFSIVPADVYIARTAAVPDEDPR